MSAGMYLSHDFRKMATAEPVAAGAPDIRVSLDGYRNAMLEEMHSLQAWFENKVERLSQFQLSPEMIRQINEELQGYSRLKFILRWVEEKNPEALNGELRKLWDWLLHDDGSRERYTNVRQAVTLLMDYEESLGDLQKRYNPDQVEQKFDEVMKQTALNMEKIEALVRDAIERLPHWNGYPIVIKAEPRQSDILRGRHDFEPAENAQVILETGDRYPPGFSLFMGEDGQVIVDDVLEGGDEDFFTDANSQADYFSLVNELQNPGSTQKTKMLSLYTARPASDRKSFESAQTLPVNIFLTNNFDHALGLASDLAGMEGTRDVWRVKIDSRYLTKTLDGPIKYYQVTVPDAPVKSLDLVYAEEE